MVKAFVFGKFLPFHKGHEAMIRFALSKCDFLSVLVCCSDMETISGDVRQKWIRNSFSGEDRMEIIVYNYSELDLPNTSEPSPEISKVWSNRFMDIFPDYNLVITSEGYGDYVASFMGINHISFDPKRRDFPVSATSIRNDLFSNWDFLPDSVKPDFVIKVVLLGTESTGKTSLVEKISSHFNCTSVMEVGRELIKNSNSFDFEDLSKVSQEHSKRIDKAVLGKSPLVIIDTDIHITKSYSDFIFKRPLYVEDRIYESNKADLYLYLNNDVEYVQDGTRLCERDRNLLDESHRKVLKDHNIDFIEITGDWDIRYKNCIESINRYILVNSKFLNFRKI